MKKTPKRRVSPLQLIVHLAGWTPLIWLIYANFTGRLTANPIQALEQQTGERALQFLLLSLACTPLSAILGWNELTQRRRALGNYGFLYAAVHVIIFIGLDYGFNFKVILGEVGNRPYVIIGLIAFLLLMPLAVTSFNYWMKRLGKYWKRLQRLVYIITPLVVIHFLMVVKGNVLTLSGNLSQPLLYGSLTLALLFLRIPVIKNNAIQLRTGLQRAVKSRVNSISG